MMPLLLTLLVEVERLRLLGSVGVLVTGKDTELAEKLLSAESGLRQHAIDSLLDHALRMLRQHGLEGREALVAHVAGVPEVPLLFRLFTRDADFRRIDHDDVVASIHVGRERRLVLAADDLRDLSRQTPKN